MLKTEAIKTTLEARRQELRNKLTEIDDELRQPGSADAEERATETEGDEVLEDMGNAALREISEIDAALTRIEIGTYGVCTSCGEPVGEKRLNALPYTAMCVECAEELD